MTEASVKPVFVDDGPRLALQEWGDPQGQPVILMHGMPGSRIGPRPRGIVLERMGVRLISYDRPGYGYSKRQPGRTVAWAAADVRRIADFLGLKDGFALVGRSGGGPHALATAALAPDLVRRVALLVSVAPPDASGLAWDSGMTTLNVDDFAEVDRSVTAAPAGTTPETASLSQRAEQMRKDPDSLVRFLLPELSKSDRRFVEDPAMRELLTATYAEAVRQGAGGWIDDAVALRSSWDFKFDDVRCPVLLWHGADDRFSPASHTLWVADQLRAVRDEDRRHEVQVQLDPGAAHFAAFEIFTEVLGWLVDPHLAPAPSMAKTAVGRALGGCGSPSSALPRSDARVQSALRAG